MLGIDEINLLKAQNEGYRKQNKDLQKEVKTLQNEIRILTELNKCLCASIKDSKEKI